MVSRVGPGLHTPVDGTAVPESPAPGRSASRIALAGALVVVATVNLWAASDARTPIQTKDEIGYLLAGRLLAGEGGAQLSAPDFAGGYGAGWGLLTVPLWWAGLSPDVLYPATIGLNVALAVAAVPVLAVLARRFGAGPYAAVLAATIVSLAPGRVPYTGYASPESLIALLTAVVAVLAWDVTRGTGGRPLLLAVAAGVLPSVHARTLPVAVLTVGLLAWLAWRDRDRTVAAGAGLAAALVAAGWVLNAGVEDVLYPDVDGRVESAGDQIAGLGPEVLALVAGGHLWYGAVAWLGLTVLGGVLLLARRHGVRDAPDQTGSTAAARWLFALCLAQCLTGAAYLSTRFGEGARIDMIVYGRYADPVWALLALVGLSALLSAPVPRRLTVAALAAGGGLCLAAWFAVQELTLQQGGHAPHYVPGLLMWLWRGGGELAVPWLPASVALLLAQALVVVTSRAGARLRTAVVVALGSALLAGTVVVERRLSLGEERVHAWYALRAEVLERQPERVVLVVDRPLLLVGNAYQFWLGDVPYRIADPADGPIRAAPGELVVARTAVGNWSALGRPLDAADRRELRMVTTDPSGRYALWEPAPHVVAGNGLADLGR